MALFIYLPLKVISQDFYCRGIFCQCYNEQENKSRFAYRKTFQKSLITLIFMNIKFFFEQQDPKTIFNFDDRYV